MASHRWTESDGTVAGTRLREHQADAPVSLSASGRKASDVRSLVPRVCARIGDWTVMALADVWAWPEDADSTMDALGRAALALGQVAEAVENRGGSGSIWIDIGDPFCALACVYLTKQRDGDLTSKVAAALRLISLTARNCNILAGTLVSLQDDPAGNLSDPGITFTRALKAYARAFARVKCPHLEATLLQLVLNERVEAEYEVEEMWEDAEARWDGLEAVDRDGHGDTDGWRWARNKWRWDEITNT
ncbi:hypothetical protein FRC09_002463 [Ceratobasidium sp. 395]|nr:hypothetical protein FRC09_002463 [Ceratobasidium sp. 395]